jgi:hypothetical protein
MQPPTNCHGSVPFPTFALFTLQASSFVSSGQWLADIIIVAQIDYDYGKRQSISSSADPARMGQARKNSAQQRNLFSRSAPLIISSDYRPQRLATLPTSPPLPKSGHFKLEMPSLPPARAIPALFAKRCRRHYGVPLQCGTYGEEVNGAKNRKWRNQ